ncbi:MAG: hypothetical protein ACM3SR_02225 [Ignavibacteriales bacterium]
MFYRITVRLAGTLFIVLAFGASVGCGGGGGGGSGEEESRIFDVELSGLQYGNDLIGSCSLANSAQLIFRPLMNGGKVSGFMELEGFNAIGPPTKVTGTVEGNNISLIPFTVSVNDGKNVAGFGPSSLNFAFSTFAGTLVDTDGDQTPDEIEGRVSGEVDEIKEGDIVVCSGSFTGNFKALADVADSGKGCLTQEELKNTQCPAAGTNKICEPFICSGELKTDQGTAIIDFIRLPAGNCQVVDCKTLACKDGSTFNNLQITETGVPSGSFPFGGGEAQLSCGS